MRSPMVMAPKDATGCFDLIRPGLIQLIQDSKGVPITTTSAKALIIKNMKRFVQTGNGLLSTSFQWTPENNIGGICQENGEGPQACNDKMGLLKTIHSRESTGFTITHPSGERRFAIHGPGLIDDQIDLISLPTNPLASHSPLTTTILQRQQNLLNVTGGDLARSKCAYGALTYNFTHTRYGDASVTLFSGDLGR